MDAKEKVLEKYPSAVCVKRRTLPYSYVVSYNRHVLEHIDLGFGKTEEAAWIDAFVSIQESLYKTY